MEFENLLTLIKTVSASELTSFCMKDGDLKISMGKEKQVVVEMAGGAEIPMQIPGNGAVRGQIQTEQKEQTTQGEAAQPEGNVVKAPLVGTFYAASAPDAEDFVKVGDTVKKGQVLGIIEAMKLMNEIESEYDGVVKEILIKNGQMAEYGQPLFVIE